LTPIDQGSATDALEAGGVVRPMMTIVIADETAAIVTEERSHSATILLT
jgi:hypothetical protein